MTGKRHKVDEKSDAKQMKRCNRCNQEKNIIEFSRDKANKDGRRTICKVCTKKIKPIFYNIKKVCKVCKKTLDISQFYRHSCLKDGYMNRCKLCEKECAREQRIKHSKTVRKRGRKYYESHHVELLKKCREYSNQYPERARARNTIKRMVKRGLLIPENCFCGIKGEGHHPDYSKPKEVIWICRRHHRRLHLLII